MSGARRQQAIRAVSTFSSAGSRPVQEDFVLVNRDKGIFVVADGFGGPAAGVAAAKTACESVNGFLEREAGDLDATLPFVLRTYFSLAGNVLFNALIHANRKVMALNQGKNVHEKGGTSVLAGFLDQDLLAIASVGACTGWLFRDGRAQELVLPRTYARLSEPFLTSDNEALRVPLMALGMADDMEPEIFEYRVQPGDWLMLNTDGVTRKQVDLVLDVHRKRLGTQESSRELAQIFEQQQASDNVAVSIVML